MFEDIFKKYINFKNITFGIVLLLFLFFIFNCKDIAIMFFASFVISCSFNPIVDKIIEKTKMSRKLAALIVVGGFILLLLAIFIPVCIMSFEQIKIFIFKLPGYIDNFDEYIFSLPLLQKFGFLANDADNLMEQISISSSDMIIKIMNIGKNIGSMFLYLMLSIIIIFNMVADRDNIKNFYLKTFPSNMRKKAEIIGNIISTKMGGYMIALLATTLSVWIVMLIGLFLLKVPYAVLLASITAVFDIIPVIGPTVALIICLMAAYEFGVGVIISIISVFVIAQLVENNLVRPYVFGKVMNVHPIIIFLFLFITAEYVGVLGVIFAPAIAAFCSVLFDELYLKKLD